MLWLGSLGGFLSLAAYMAYRTYTDYLDPAAKTRDTKSVVEMPLYKGNPVVFMDFEWDGEALGRVTFQLRRDLAPYMAENFRKLATGERGFGFQDSFIHSVVPGSMICGGDITHGLGSGGRAADGRPFPADITGLRHMGPGVLSMEGHKNALTSRFVITLARDHSLDQRHFVLGNVVSGMEVLQEMERRAAVQEAAGGPRGHRIRIADAGELKLPPDAYDR